jgi:hypothetical protein
MKTLLKRLIGAARLDAQTYEDVEADRGSTGSAVLVVVVASIAAAVGAGAGDWITVSALVVTLLVTWMVWVGLTVVIGTALLPEPQTHADIGEVLRTTGFSASPGILRILGGLPVIGWPIFIVATFWMLFSSVVAIRQALDYRSARRALAVCILGWMIHGILLFGFVRIAV